MGIGALLPPPSPEARAFRLPLVSSSRAVRPTLCTREALVAEALAARHALAHRRFVSALTALTLGPPLRQVEPLARLASGAYGLEAVELVSILAGRWVHAARPGARERRRVAQTLGPKLHCLDAGATARAALLVLEPDAERWLWFAQRDHAPPMFVFDLVRVAMARSPQLRWALDQAGAVSGTAAAWAAAARGIAWDDRCGCGDCVLRSA